jgi:hypothetical protein
LHDDVHVVRDDVQVLHGDVQAARGDAQVVHDDVQVARGDAGGREDEPRRPGSGRCGLTRGRGIRFPRRMGAGSFGRTTGRRGRGVATEVGRRAVEADVEDGDGEEGAVAKGGGGEDAVVKEEEGRAGWVGADVGVSAWPDELHRREVRGAGEAERGGPGGLNAGPWLLSLRRGSGGERRREQGDLGAGGARGARERAGLASSAPRTRVARSARWGGVAGSRGGEERIAGTVGSRESDKRIVETVGSRGREERIAGIVGSCEQRIPGSVGSRGARS